MNVTDGVKGTTYVKKHTDRCIPCMPLILYTINKVKHTLYGAAISTEPGQLSVNAAGFKPPFQASVNHFLRQFCHAAREAYRSKRIERHGRFAQASTNGLILQSSIIQVTVNASAHHFKT